MRARYSAACAGLLLSGCWTPAAYGSARTLPRGSTATTVTLDGFAIADGAELEVSPVPNVRVGGRAGIGERADIGVQVSLTLMSAEVDLKAQLVRTDVVDVSLAPTVGAAWNLHGFLEDLGDALSGTEDPDRPLLAPLAQLPLLVELRATDSFSVMPIAAVGTAMLPPYDEDVELAATVGLSLRFRLGRGAVLQPTIALTWDLGGPGALASGGLALQLGREVP